MLPTDRIQLFTGVVLLLLAAALIVSGASSFAIGDANPFERDEIDDVLNDINDNEEAYIVTLISDIVTDAALSIAAAAGLYLVFRDRYRRLALLGLAFILVSSAAFLASDAGAFVLTFLADDFAEGGPEGIAAGDPVIAEVARAVGIFSLVAAQAGITALSLGILSFGLLIGWAPAAGATPPRWLGWLATLAGVVGVFTWLIAATDAAFVLFIITAVAILLWLIALGGWLVMTAEAEGPLEPTGARL